MRDKRKCAHGFIVGISVELAIFWDENPSLDVNEFNIHFSCGYSVLAVPSSRLKSPLASILYISIAPERRMCFACGGFSRFSGMFGNLLFGRGIRRKNVGSEKMREQGEVRECRGGRRLERAAGEEQLKEGLEFRRVEEERE